MEDDAVGVVGEKMVDDGASYEVSCEVGEDEDEGIEVNSFDVLVLGVSDC